MKITDNKNKEIDIRSFIRGGTILRRTYGDKSIGYLLCTEIYNCGVLTFNLEYGHQVKLEPEDFINGKGKIEIVEAELIIK